MFDFFKKIFSTSENTKYSYFQLYNKLSYWKENKVLPYSFNLPKQIVFPENFWKEIVKMYKSTASDGMERAISVFWVDGDLVLTSLIKGDQKSVKTNSSVEVKYEQSIHKGYLKKKIFVDGSIYSEKEIYYKNLPKKTSLQYLFNLHTHPAHHTMEKDIYGFFSSIDIQTFTGSDAIITGLITDKLWILIKTSETKNLLLQDQEITKESLTQRLFLAVYEGDFHEPLQRFSLQLSNNNTSVNQ